MTNIAKIVCFALILSFVFRIESKEVESIPQFNDYKTKVQQKFNKNIKLNFSDKKNRQFRTLLKGSLSEAPNFAGKFIIVSWGCGSSCQRHAIINKNSGEVYWPKEIEASFNLTACDIDTLEFQSNSTLLVVNEHRPKMGIIKIFYDWNGIKLRKISTQSIKKELCVIK